MIIYMTEYYGCHSTECNVKRLDLANKHMVLRELNTAAETDNGHDFGETQHSYFAAKNHAENHAKKLIKDLFWEEE